MARVFFALEFQRTQANQPTKKGDQPTKSTNKTFEKSTIKSDVHPENLSTSKLTWTGNKQLQKATKNGL